MINGHAVVVPLYVTKFVCCETVSVPLPMPIHFMPFIDNLEDGSNGIRRTTAHIYKDS